MANEIRLQLSLQINKGNLVYSTPSTAFLADMDGDPKAPTPGHVRISEQGTDISFAGLTRPGWCYIKNLDSVNYVQFGVYNTDQSEFYPLIRLYPGEHCIIPLDPEINEEYAGTGTGTTGQLNTFRGLAQTSPVNVWIDAFER